MGRAALVWFDGEHLRRVTVGDATSAVTIGRDPGSAVDLSDRNKYDRFKAVSRRHAQVRMINGAFFVEHLSTTNPTKVNGTRVNSGRPQPLSDQDLIDVGGLRLTFHDLAAADRISGVVCPSCGRENEPSRQDCWYDGTNLVNALTAPRRMLRAYLRAASEGGEFFDLYASDALVVDAGGRCEKHPARGTDRRGGVVLVDQQDGHPVVKPLTPGAEAEFNGTPLTGSETVKDGDELWVGRRRLVFIVR